MVQPFFGAKLNAYLIFCLEICTEFDTFYQQALPGCTLSCIFYNKQIIVETGEKKQNCFLSEPS